MTSRARSSILVALAVSLAACTSSSGVTTEESSGGSATVATDVGGGGTAPGTSIGGSTPVVAPDPSGLPDLTEADPAIVIGELDNGLRYLIRENDNPGSRVDMRLTIDAGSGRQEPDQGGAAHFLEHMLFNGTDEFPENELVAVLRSFGAAFGADVNAYTSYDETVYSLTMPSDDDEIVDTGLTVLQQWLTAATIDPEQVVAERGVVLDEWRGSAQSADGRIFDRIQAFFLDDSPYENRLPIGDDDEISSMEPDTLRRFYDAWYRPDNAAVILVGDIDADEIEARIVELFGDAAPRGEAPPADPISVEPPSEPRVDIVDDPDMTRGFAFVTLPTAASVDPAVVSPGADADRLAASLQRAILDGLAFDIVATRLGNDALRGEAPFDDARVDSSGFVRLLEAPEILVTADGADMEAAVQAVLDEYERVRRHGVTAAEVERAVAELRSAAQVDFDGRDSRQDSSFADEYVRHVLEGESVPTAERWFEFVTEVLDRATPETVAYGFVDRLDRAAPHMFVAVPQDEAGDVPDAPTFVAIAESVRSRDIAPRAADAEAGDELMVAPEPVEETSTTRLADGSDVSFVAPTLLTFPNGVRVAINATPIVDGAVLFDGRSPGGTSVIADADVAAADAASSVVELSGVGAFDPVALDSVLAGAEVEIDLSIGVFEETVAGFAATTDLETLLQLVHLVMTEPRVDLVALGQYVDDRLPLAENPSLDPGHAALDALLEARYDDVRYLFPEVAELESLDAEEIRRVFLDRFGDASDWVFSISGDLDVGDTVELARRYLGTLPATGRVDTVDRLEPDPPSGVVVETVNAGEGEQASVQFLFTGPGSTDRRDDLVAQLVQSIITARLTDVIREQLGESYSPFAVAQIGSGGSPFAEIYLSISTGPDLVDDVSRAVLGELDDLRADGIDDASFASAAETLRRELELFSNEQINDEILRALVDPEGNASLDEFLTQDRLLSSITAADVSAALRTWAPADRWIEIRTLPR